MNTDYNDSQPLEDKNKYEQEPEEEVSEPEPKIPFWYENPNVLIHSDYIYELFPTDDMEYAQMLNAVTRTAIFMTLVLYIIAPNARVLLLLAVTLGVIFLMYHYSKKERDAEAFQTNVARDYLEKEGTKMDANTMFTAPSAKNPFGNVLVTDTGAKKPAPPAYNGNVREKIITQAKNAIQDANPSNPGIADKLFKDLGSELTFEQSLRQFTSNPSTTLPNDQEAFAHFCYGSMISCKEGNAFACARNAAKYTNY